MFPNNAQSISGEVNALAGTIQPILSFNATGTVLYARLKEANTSQWMYMDCITLSGTSTRRIAYSNSVVNEDYGHYTCPASSTLYLVNNNANNSLTQYSVTYTTYDITKASTSTQVFTASTSPLAIDALNYKDGILISGVVIFLLMFTALNYIGAIFKPRDKVIFKK